MVGGGLFIILFLNIERGQLFLWEIFKGELLNFPRGGALKLCYGRFLRWGEREVVLLL